MDKEYPDLMEYEYVIRFERIAETYRLVHYNTPWENDREFEDIRIMFDGLDLNNNDLSPYKIVSWEPLSPGLYDVKAEVKFIRNADKASYEQIFFLKELKQVNLSVED